MTFPEIVKQTIVLAKAANQSLATQEGETMMEHVTPEQERLRQFLESQPANVVYMLLTLMYLGRDDYLEEWSSFLELSQDIGESFGDAKLAAWQMLVTVPLAEYLEAGLNLLANNGVDVKNLVAA